MKWPSLSIRKVLLLLISALTLLIVLLVMRNVHMEWRQLAKIRGLKEASILSGLLFEATDKILVERDIAYSMLYAPDRETVDSLAERMEESRREADAAMQQALQRLERYEFPELIDLRQRLTGHVVSIRAIREKVDVAVSLPKVERDMQLAERWYGEVSTLLAQVQATWTEFIGHFTDINPNVTQHLRFRHLLRVITDHAGEERLVIGRMIVENADITMEDLSRLLRGQGVVDQSWQMSYMLAVHSGLFPAIAPAYKDARSHYLTMRDMTRNIFYLPGTRQESVYPIGIDLWFELTMQVEESLKELKIATRQETRRYTDQLEQEAKDAIASHVFLLVLACVLCLYSFRIVTRRVLKPITDMIEALLAAIEGKPVTFTPPAERHDEIGKLAQVLHAFQMNVEQIRRTTAMLERYTRALERSNKELDDFAYIASHDLKEPLRGLHNHARFLLEDNQGKLDADSVSRLQRLSYLAQRMERLVNDLLYFSRLGRQGLAIQPTDLNGVVHDIESTLEIFLQENHARITVPRPLPVITCDKTRITEVFRNLITNGVKYNDKAEKTIEVGYLNEASVPEGGKAAYVFYVRDNGRGIAEEFYEEIFRIFKRLQSGTEEDGTGVGLTFVKKIIERHGGKIWVESAVGKGSTFYFTLENVSSISAAA